MPFHCPQALHRTDAQVGQAFPGVQTGVCVPHEHAPHVQLEVHVSKPYVLQDCVLFGAHPWPAHVPSCQYPLELHVCVSVPQ